VNFVLKVSISLIPVFLFLTSLVALDSYKLVKLRTVILSIVIGGIVAILCMYLNNWIINYYEMSMQSFVRYISPLTEEILKSAFIIYVIMARKTGFLVDSAILGFAVGAGFALVENVYYLQSVESTNMLLWFIRGFGTAVMHGSTTAMVAFISKDLFDRHGSSTLWNFLPGLSVAYLVHSTYNHFLLPPILGTAVLLVVLPLLTSVVFARSERATRDWLGVGLDADVELLESIISGDFGQTRIGKYLQSLKGYFPGEVVADMLCLLRIRLELALKAKGMLMMRESGVNLPPDESVREMFVELRFLEGSIGKTGKLAMMPFLHGSNRDLWQINILRE